MRIRKTAVAAGVLSVLLAGTAAQAYAPADTAVSHSSASTSRPTIVLIHGVFEDATSAWGDVTSRLQGAGYRVVAPAVPLRGIESDVTYLSAVLDSIPGPIILAGHSYGGVLISALAARNPQVAALVYVAAFIPEVGETINELNGQFPGTLLGPDTTYTITRHDGGADLYARPEAYRSLLAGDRPAAAVAATAAAQRPLDTAALTEPTTTQAPAATPKYALIATDDNAVPTAAQMYEAQRADAHTYYVDSAHDMPTSHPGTVADILKQAATATGSTS